MRQFFVSIAALAFILFLSSSANAQFKRGDFDFSLNGSGHSDKNLSNTQVSANAGLGYFLTSDFEIGLRQGVVLSSTVAGQSSVFADYNFTFGKLVPFVGVSGGYAYGSTIPNYWSAGPEVGVRYFLNSTTYVFGDATYQFNLNKGINTGEILYGVGLGLRF